MSQQLRAAAVVSFGATVGAAAAAPRGRATFATQADALLRKNGRYQLKNWKTNCCLVLTPLVFSVVLGVLNFVVNDVLFNQPNLQCGCRCRAFTTPEGNFTFDLASFSHVNADNVTVWNQPLVDPRTGESYPWDTRVLKCSGGYDTSVCNAAVSDVQNRLFCPITKPMRWLPLVQVPNPPVRPTNTAGFPDDPAWNESWSWTLSGTDRESALRRRANFSRAAPFLYTAAANNAQAAQLAQRMLFSDTSAVTISNLVTQTMTSLATSLASNATVYEATLAAPLVRFAANLTGPIADVARAAETLSLYPGLSPLLLGTASSQQRGTMQRNDAYAARPLKYLHTNCSMLPRRVRGNLSATLGRVFGNVDFACVSMPGVAVANLSAMQMALYSGYGKGAPGGLTGRSALANYPFALDLKDTNVSSKMSLVLLFNSTPIFELRYALNIFHRVSAPLNRLANAFVDMAAAPGAVGGQPRMVMRYVRDMPTQGLALRLDVGLLLGPLFYTWLSQMLLPVIVSLLVYEKEKNLRTMMKIQGLGDSAYMLVNYVYYFLLYFVFMLLIYVYGAALGFGTNSLPMWTRSEAGVIVVFDLLFVNVQVVTAFLFQALFSNAKTATVGCVVYILISGLLGKFLLEPFLESPEFGQPGITGMQLLVPFSLYRGYYEMAAFGLAASYQPRDAPDDYGRGITWAKLRGSHGMDDVMIIFFVEWLLIGMAAYYLDQVYVTGSGLKRHPLFFLDSCRRNGGIATADTELRQLTAMAVETEAADVIACRDAALAITDPAQVAVLARQLGKTYPAVDGAPPKLACRELSVAISAGECFGLLGPNGAGKTTMIGLLIGFLTPSRGAAFIKGHNLRTDLDTVYSMLGVCPQHDLLWEQLTAREHLRFYGRLKSLAGAALEAACDEALRGVNLFNGGVGDRPCGTYSGGMKRRLSVAIALIGDPPVVFLDEPSTGLDPASRATLWEVIKRAKQTRAVILTSHAMSEAEELCDRVGIVVDGALRCVGHPRELTARYGGFLVLTLTLATAARAGDAAAFVRRLAPGAQQTYALGCTLKYDLPLAEVSLADVFAAVTQQGQEQLGIADWGVSHMTLEETFIKLAQEIGAQTDE